MRNRNLIFAVFLALFPIIAVAGNEVGNGGDAVVCRNSDQSIKSAQLLDFYEFELLNNSKVDLGSPHFNVTEKVQYALARLQTFAPTRAKIYRDGFKHFFNETYFEQNSSLPDISDSGDVILPRGCKVEQVAIQSTCPPNTYPIPPSQECLKRPKETYISWDAFVPNRYVIDQKIWNAMDTNSKAGLILHELIYREAVHLLSMRNSVFVRKINGLISSDFMNKANQDEFNLFLLNHNFSSVDYSVLHGANKNSFFITYYYYFGNRIETTPEFYQNGSIAKAYYMKNVPALIDQQWVYLTHDQWSNKLRWNSEGLLHQLTLDDASPDYRFKWADRFYSTRGYTVNDDLSYADIRLVGNAVETILGQPRRIGKTNANGISRLRLTAQGKVSVAELAEPMSVRTNLYNVNLEIGSEIHIIDNKDELSYFSQASGKVLGSNLGELFELNKASVYIDEGKVTYVDGEFTAIVQVHPEAYKIDRIQISNYYHFINMKNPNLNVLFIGKTVKPLKCKAKGNTYEVQTDIEVSKIKSDFAVTKAKELPKLNALCMIEEKQ